MNLVDRSRRFWPFNYIGERQVITKGANGYFYVYDPLDLSIGLHMLLEGDHEPWLAPVLQGILRPGDTVIDVGSNIGFHSVVMADLVQAFGKVYCCEPNDAVHDYLLRNLTINGFRSRCILVDGIMSDVNNAEDVFNVFQDNSGGCSTQVLPGNKASLAHSFTKRTSTVISLVGDRPIKLLKIDAEGAEARVLRGAHGCIIENYIIENNKDYYIHELDEEVEYLRSLGKVCIPLGENIAPVQYNGTMKDLFVCDVWIR